MNDSLIPPREILKTYDILKEEYRKLVEQDSSNELFGSPDNFYKVLNPKEITMKKMLQ